MDQIISGYFKNRSRLMQIVEDIKDGVELNHAYLFLGNKGVGMYTAACQIAKEVLGVFDLSMSNDYMEIGKDSPIAVDDIRDVVEWLNMMPTGKRKVLVLDNAETMSKSAANAFLKALEEQIRDDTSCFIVCHEKPIGTILSRCMDMTFTSSDNLVSEYLLDKGELFSAMEYLVAEGCVGRAEQILSDKDYRLFIAEVEKGLLHKENPFHYLRVYQDQESILKKFGEDKVRYVLHAISVLLYVSGFRKTIDVLRADGTEVSMELGSLEKNYSELHRAAVIGQISMMDNVALNDAMLYGVAAVILGGK